MSVFFFQGYIYLQPFEILFYCCKRSDGDVDCIAMGSELSYFVALVFVQFGMIVTFKSLRCYILGRVLCLTATSFSWVLHTMPENFCLGVLKFYYFLLPCPPFMIIICLNEVISIDLSSLTLDSPPTY